MDTLQTITLIVFLVTIFLVIVRWIDSVVAAMLGVIVMVMVGSMTEADAFRYVDWNVITILVSVTNTGTLPLDHLSVISPRYSGMPVFPK